MLSPAGMRLNLIKRGTTGTWAGSGMTKAEFLLLDSTTGEVLMAAADEHPAGFTERYTELGSVKAAFKFWAERGVKFVEDVRSGKQ